MVMLGRTEVPWNGSSLCWQNWGAQAHLFPFVVSIYTLQICVVLHFTNIYKYLLFSEGKQEQWTWGRREVCIRSWESGRWGAVVLMYCKLYN